MPHNRSPSTVDARSVCFDETTRCPGPAAGQGPLRYSGSSILAAPAGTLRHVSARLRGPPESPRSPCGCP